MRKKTIRTLLAALCFCGIGIINSEPVNATETRVLSETIESPIYYFNTDFPNAVWVEYNGCSGYVYKYGFLNNYGEYPYKGILRKQKPGGPYYAPLIRDNKETK